VRLVGTIKTVGPVSVQGDIHEVRLPVKDAKLPAEARQEVEQARQRLGALTEADASEQELDRAALDLLYAETHEDQAKRLATCLNREVATALQGIAVHDCLFLGLPGEVFTEIGSSLKEASPFKHTCVVGYANDGMGYFPSVEALRSADGYEVIVSILGEVAVARLVESGNVLASHLHG